MGDSEKDSDSDSLKSQEMGPGCGSCDCPPTAFYSLGSTFLLLGALIFAIFCSEVVPGYHYTKDFERATCTVTSAGFVDDVCCESSVKKMSQCENGYDYPCAHVSVTYKDNDDIIRATLYDEYKSTAFESKTAHDEQCSYFHCGSASYKDHKKNAKDFLKKYSIGGGGNGGDDVTCYVDAKNHKRVALVTKTSSSSFGTLLAFSLIFIVGGASICLITFAYTTVVNRKAMANRDQSKEELIDEETPETSSIKNGRQKTEIPSAASKSGIMFDLPQIVNAEEDA